MLFQISDDLFWGFQCTVDTDLFASHEEICTYIVKQLKIELVRLHLVVLLEKLEEKNFHIHHIDKDDNVTYVCTHHDSR